MHTHVALWRRPEAQGRRGRVAACAQQHAAQLLPQRPAAAAATGAHNTGKRSMPGRRHHTDARHNPGSLMHTHCATTRPACSLASARQASLAPHQPAPCSAQPSASAPCVKGAPTLGGRANALSAAAPRKAGTLQGRDSRLLLLLIFRAAHTTRRAHTHIVTREHGRPAGQGCVPCSWPAARAAAAWTRCCAMHTCQPRAAQAKC